MQQTLLILFLSLSVNSFAQTIGNFVSVEPLSQSSDFVIPPSHIFQRIIEKGDSLTQGGILLGNNDFAGYVPINNSSENGYLSINTELDPGGAVVLDIHFNNSSKLWETSYSKAIDFSSVFGTSTNCSGTVTPWNTIISCEELQSANDYNSDGYYDLGWCVEINPATKMVINKLWALGNLFHENVVIHQNHRTVYEGSDSNPGYLYKFVADSAQNLSSGKLYVYKGSKNGSGDWILLNNTTKNERNNTLQQSAAVGATVFNGVEDVDIGPDGMVYFAVKTEECIYRFNDSDPITGTTVPMMETFVGNMAYDITHANGVTSHNWGAGNDNLVFDNEGNLWVTQDYAGTNNYIWVVEQGHTQANPKVKIFARTPTGSEPTGLTFSPDYRFLFMSIQHPFSTNNSTSQIDAAGNMVAFDKDITLVISLKDSLGFIPIHTIQQKQLKLPYPNPSSGILNIDLEQLFEQVEIEIHNQLGQLILHQHYNNSNNISLDLSTQPKGIYVVVIKTAKEIVGTFEVLRE